MKKLVWGGKYEMEKSDSYSGPNVGIVAEYIAYGKRGGIYGGLVYEDGRFHWLNLSHRASTVPFDLAQVSPAKLFGEV